jgi:hypothetical protein
MTQEREELWKPLCFVNYDRPGMGVEETFQVGGKQLGVRWPLEVEMSPIREHVPRERALAALPRPDDQDRRERLEKRTEPLLLEPVDVSHTL